MKIISTLATIFIAILLMSCNNSGNQPKSSNLTTDSTLKNINKIDTLQNEQPLSQDVFAQFDANARYTLSPNFQPTKSLDVINDGKNNRVWLDKTQNVTGQFWKISPVIGMQGYYRLSPDFQPTKSLDVINDGENNRVWLDKTQNVTGQFWKIEIAE
ncbi:MAG: hypothetical protein ACK444_10435 [Flavobacteriales bacterium]|jgi:hypothetical protein